MKTLLLSLSLLLPLAAAAQEGHAVYQVTTRIDIELPPEMARLRDQMPSERTAQKSLYFDGTATLTRELPREDEDQTIEDGGNRIVFRSRVSPDVLHVDYDAWATTEQKDFLGRTFLIDGEPREWAWRLTDERSEFLGYLCQKAVAERDSTTIEAWFTPEIPVSVGPEHYHGLPGLILVLTEDDGRRTFTAESVELAPLADGALTPPADGRRVTREEYDRIVEEKMAEMEAEMGSGRGIIIRKN